MTIILDKQAFRHYAPKELHDHLRGFDALLVKLMRNDRQSKQMVDHPFTIFSAEAFYPIIHLVAMKRFGEWTYFPSPRRAYTMKDGHRFVTENANAGERRSQPRLCFEVVSDPALTNIDIEKVKSNMVDGQLKTESELMVEFTEQFKQTIKPAVLLSGPLAIFKKGVAGRFLQQRFTLYQHIFGAGHEYPHDGPFYIGITSRDWKKRWSEHWAAIQRGSPLKFHRTYRQRVVEKKLTYVHHKVMGVAQNLDRIQELEEAFVQGHWDDDRLLNMIPGGKAGIVYLHKHRILDEKVKPTPDQVERLLEDWTKEHPRKGLPAPWVADAWKSDDYALKLICGPEGRLSVDQVLQIRLLAAGGVEPAKIAEQVGAKNVAQVERVVQGKTYSRVTHGEESG